MATSTIVLLSLAGLIILWVVFAYNGAGMNEEIFGGFYG